MQIIDVEVDHVKLMPLRDNLVQHQYVVRKLVDALRIEPERARADGNKLGLSE
jgi:hypothetical protein